MYLREPPLNKSTSTFVSRELIISTPSHTFFFIYPENRMHVQQKPVVRPRARKPPSRPEYARILFLSLPTCPYSLS